MIIINAIALAFRQIRRNFLRAFLTMLGIIIGVSSVIVMISLGNGTTQMVTDSITSLGSNVILIMPSRDINTSGKSSSRGFTVREAEDIRDRVPGLKAVAPTSGGGSVVLRYLRNNTQSPAMGVTEDYFIASDLKVDKGRLFSQKDYRSGANVCIIGESSKKALFDDESPLGARIKADKIVCECIGVLESKGQNMGNDSDDIILFPLKTYQRNISSDKSLNNVNNILISVEDGVDSQFIVSLVDKVLRNMRGLKEGQASTFDIMDSKEIQKMLFSTTKLLTLFLGSVASVSLLVGGIGIMNIMLVSVTERTKEIGTRLAIGALEKEVLLQFLIESITISSVGGLIGIVLSFFISKGLSGLMKVPFVYDIQIVFIAFGFSAFIGVLFGYLPARKASKLNPIDALRHE